MDSGACGASILSEILASMTGDDKRIPKRRPEPVSRMLDAMFRGHPGARRARGFAALRRDWADIVGPEFADVVWPERLETPHGKRPAALVVKVVSGAALLLQHEEPRLVERINSFLGDAAVGRLRIAPGAPPPRRKPRPAISRLPDDHPLARRVDARAAAVQDPELAAALARLGKAVAASRDRTDDER